MLSEPSGGQGHGPGRVGGRAEVVARRRRRRGDCGQATGAVSDVHLNLSTGGSTPSLLVSPLLRSMRPGNFQAAVAHLATATRPICLTRDGATFWCDRCHFEPMLQKWLAASSSAPGRFGCTSI